MCTLTWWPAETGYDLFFNRDELDTRAPESPPCETGAGAVNFLAPRDGDHGGTWLAVNQHGLTVALLNDYASAWRPAEVKRSRGALVLACAPADSLATVESVVRAGDLTGTSAFHLVAVDAAVTPLALHWNGERLEARRGAEVPGFFSSSSFRTADVIAHRHRLYCELTRTGEHPALAAVQRYHRFHDTSAGAYSVCMRRPDAATRSITHVSVRPEAVELTYEPQARLGGSSLAAQRCRLLRLPAHAHPESRE